MGRRFSVVVDNGSKRQVYDFFGKASVGCIALAYQALFTAGQEASRSVATLHWLGLWPEWKQPAVPTAGCL